MTKADTLSRMAELQTGLDDNKDITIFQDSLFVQSQEQGHVGEDLITRIRAGKGNLDEGVTRKLGNNEPGWIQEDGVIYWQGRIYIPKDSRLREEIIRNHHDPPTSVHPGRYKPHKLITRNYWWPGLQWDVNKYVNGCETCQRTKSRRTPWRAPLNPHDVPEGPWETISVNLIGELPTSKGYNRICVIVDRFSKQTHLIPTSMTVTAQGMAEIYRDHIFRLHGIPKKIIHDRGPQFDSLFMKNLYKLIGIEGNPSTAYHPQTDGQTERVNQEVKQYLRIYVNHHQDDWADWLPIAEFSLNKIQVSTGYSPFFISYGHHLNSGNTVARQSINETTTEFAKRMKGIHEDCQATLVKAMDNMK